MMTRRRCTCAVTVGSNMIYVIGGHDGAQILNTIEKYETERYEPFRFQRKFLTRNCTKELFSTNALLHCLLERNFLEAKMPPMEKFHLPKRFL